MAIIKVTCTLNCTGEEFAEEERDWITIDKILSPHVYDLEEKLSDRITEPDADGLVRDEIINLYIISYLE
jgi:hypothetical protein